VLTEFVRIVAVKEVDITGRNTGAGALAGAAAGGAGGSYIGNGSGSGWAIAGGAVAGAVIGAAVEQEMANRKGYEYIVVTEDKKTKTIVQNQSPTDKVFQPGDRAIMQIKGSYQRLIPLDGLPDTVKKPEGFNIVD
jgi:outer membrane lipoprotein SlyB